MKAALITEEQIKAIDLALNFQLTGDLYKALAIVKSLKAQEPVAWWNSTKDRVSTDPYYRKDTECTPLYAGEKP